MPDESSSSSAVAGPSSYTAAPSMPTPAELSADPQFSDAQIPPPPFYHAASQAASASIASIRSSLHKFPTPTLKIQRVNQLDAELLDRELAQLLLDPVKKALASIQSTLPTDLEPELLLGLQLALFKFSIWDRGASYGSMLQNLRYRNEWAHRGALQSTARDQPLSRLQLALYPVLTILAPYAGTKIQNHMTSLSYSEMQANDPRRLLWKLFDNGHRVWSAAVLVNFAIFLGNGKYRSVADRLLGMRLTYSQRTMNRNISFEFLNRQLVWHAFTEFLLFLLPLVKPKRLLRRVMRLPTNPTVLGFIYTFLPRILTSRLGIKKDQTTGRTRFDRNAVTVPGLKQLAAPKQTDEGASQGGSEGPYAHLPAFVCAICFQRMETLAGTKSDPTKIGTGGLSMGIPTSDPLDPSSGLLAPNRPSSSSQPVSTTASTASKAEVQDGDESLGVSPDGLAYADALVYTPYETVPCGHVYCYVCIAGQMLSEDMEDELEEETEDGSHGWKCLRCNLRVRETRRAQIVQVDEEEQEDSDAEAG